MNTILCTLYGYFIGSINPSYLIGKIKGFDIRKVGSGNAGASNAVITMGPGVGVFSALFDIFKAFLAVYFASVLFPQLQYAREIAGTACIIGHIFPFYMRFHGGKGLACIGGVVLSYDWRIFLILLVTAVIVVLIVDYICIIPVALSVVFPMAYGLMTGRWIGSLIFAFASIAILMRHMENIQRIIDGKEAHFSYLWRKEEETNRIIEQMNSSKSENK